MTTLTKIAIVTGAGSGIGKAAALALLKDGYGVALAGRRKEMLESTASESGAGKRALAVPTDVTDPGSVRALFAQTKQTFGRLDVLFNNAGVNLPSIPTEDLEFEVWQRMVNTNLTGMFLCIQEAIKLMKSQDPIGGRIINNGSIAAHAPRPDTIAYTATKHAVTGLTKSTSLDGRKYDIACGQIDIGNAASAMGGRMAKGVPQANGTIEPEATMDLESVAAAVLHMANLPLGVNVQFMTIMATKMPFVGRG